MDSCVEIRARPGSLGVAGRGSLLLPGSRVAGRGSRVAAGVAGQRPRATPPTPVPRVAIRVRGRVCSRSWRLAAVWGCLHVPPFRPKPPAPQCPHPQPTMPKAGADPAWPGACPADWTGAGFVIVMGRALSAACSSALCQVGGGQRERERRAAGSSRAVRVAGADQGRRLGSPRQRRNPRRFPVAAARRLCPCPDSEPWGRTAASPVPLRGLVAVL